MTGQEYDRETIGRRAAFEAAAEDQATELVVTARSRDQVRYVGWDDPGLSGLVFGSEPRRICAV